MSEDFSPSSKPFQARLREATFDDHADHSNARVVNEYVDLAKRSLLENRVRDFTAADVVALAAIMERREREMKGKK